MVGKTSWLGPLYAVDNPDNLPEWNAERWFQFYNKQPSLSLLGVYSRVNRVYLTSLPGWLEDVLAATGKTFSTLTLAEMWPHVTPEMKTRLEAGLQLACESIDGAPIGVKDLRVVETSGRAAPFVSKVTLPLGAAAQTVELVYDQTLIVTLASVQDEHTAAVAKPIREVLSGEVCFIFHPTYMRAAFHYRGSHQNILSSMANMAETMDMVQTEAPNGLVAGDHLTVINV
jgi:hypothetical protein